MKRIIYLSVALLSITLTTGCKQAESNKNVPNAEVEDIRLFISKEQFNQNQMALGQMKKMTFPNQIHASGMIDVPPENRAIVSAMTGGFIKSSPFLVGNKVRKGQALVTLESPEIIKLQQSYLEVKEQLTYLKAESKRQEVMLAENITSKKNFLKAESAYKSGLALANGLAKQLKILNISPEKINANNISSLATIYAPISGSITKMNVTIGMHVSPATEILEIIDTDHIHLELTVFEKDVMRVKEGQMISFKIPEVSDSLYKADVFLVGTSIDENRRIQIHGHLEDETKHHFLSGMFIEADIITSEKESTALASEAIVEIEDKHYVLKLDEKNDKGYYFLQIGVPAGQSHKNYTSLNVSENLNLEDQFLIAGAFSLISE